MLVYEPYESPDYNNLPDGFAQADKLLIVEVFWRIIGTK